jgi:hypothetical protein
MTFGCTLPREMVAPEPEHTLRSRACPGLPAAIRRTSTRRTMLDIILIAVGAGFIALSIFYTIACDRL